MKKYLFFCLIALIGFSTLSLFHANADIGIFGQGDHSSYWSSGDFFASFGGPGTFAFTAASTGRGTDAHLFLEGPYNCAHSCGTGVSWVMSIYDHTPAFPLTQLVATSSVTHFDCTYPSACDVDFNFPAPGLFTAGDTYDVIVDPSDGQAKAFGSSSSGSHSSPPLYFELVGVPHASSLSIAAPFDDQLFVPPNMVQWGVLYDAGDGTAISTTTPGFIDIRFSPNSDFSDPVGVDEGPISAPVNLTDLGAAIPHSQDFSSLSTSTTWYAQALLFDSAANNYNLISTSTVISFTIGEAGQSLPKISCNFGAGDFITDPLGTIKQGICEGLVFLFYPSQGSLNNFSGLGDRVKNKPPFGYFTSIKSAFDNLATGTSSIQVMSTTTATDFAGIFSPIDTGLAIIVGVIGGTWLFKRMRHLEL